MKYSILSLRILIFVVLLSNKLLCQTISFTYDANKNMLTKTNDGVSNNIVQNTQDVGMASLRGVIADACPEDTVKFSPSLATQTILLTGQEIKLSKPLYILGLGMDNLTITSENTGRIFNIDHDVVLGIEGLRLIKGESPQDGGAILNLSNDLLLKNVKFELNKEGTTDKALTNMGKISVVGDVIVKL